MSADAPLEVRDAEPGELQAVRRMFAELGYEGDADGERVVVALQGGRLVGAFRLVHEHGALVLRGMRVVSDRRGAGIGSRLLAALRDLEEPCFLISHAHLERFYERAGFVAAGEGEAPPFLRRRAEDYRVRRGLVPLLMRREPHAGDRP